MEPQGITIVTSPPTTFCSALFKQREEGWERLVLNDRTKNLGGIRDDSGRQGPRKPETWSFPDFPLSPLPAHTVTIVLKTHR